MSGGLSGEGRAARGEGRDQWRGASGERVGNESRSPLATHHSPLTTSPLATAFAVVRVSDGGDGMAADMLPRIFDLFTQADRSLDRADGGLGIGLALVKSLVEMHRGTVEVRSDGIGRGSEFIVRLPLSSSPPGEPASAGGSASGSATGSTTESATESDAGTRGDSGTAPQPLRILVVDDSRDAARMSAMLLRSWGHDVRAAHDGPAALQRSEGFNPQVILLDIGLPDMDGYEVARIIRRKPECDHVCLIAVTGYGQDSDRQRSMDEGFDHHLVKPVEAHELQQLLAGITLKH